MRLSIDHQTGFRYASPVASSYNEARMTPRHRDTRRCGAAGSASSRRLELHLHRLLGHHGDHLRAARAARAADRARPGGGRDARRRPSWDTDRRVAPNDLGWAALHDRGVIDSMTEFLTVTPAPSRRRSCSRWPQARRQPPRLAGARHLRADPRQLTYQRGSTAVTSTAREVWELGRGVCQDYSHVALGALRSIGLPARYVSGYLHPGGAATQHHGRGREPLLDRVVVRELGRLRPDPARL